MATAVPFATAPIRRRMSSPAEEDFIPPKMFPRERSFVVSNNQNHFPGHTESSSHSRIHFRTTVEHDSMPQLPTYSFQSSAVSKSLLSEQLRQQTEHANKHIERVSDEEDEGDHHVLPLGQGVIQINNLSSNDTERSRRRHSCREPSTDIAQSQPQMRQMSGTTVVVEQRLSDTANREQQNNTSPLLAANAPPYLAKFKRQRHMQLDPENYNLAPDGTNLPSDNNMSPTVPDHAFTFDSLEQTNQLSADIAPASPPRAVSNQDTLATRTRFLCNDPNGTGNLTTIADTLRRPAIQLTKFGTMHNWALDIFALPHNAVRAECVDLYNILESIHARSPQIVPMEMEEFNAWWIVFESFVIEYFDFEADELFRWVFPRNGNDRETGSIDIIGHHKGSTETNIKNCLLAKKEEILQTIRQLNGTFELRHHVDVSDSFQTILKTVNTLVPKLFDYFKAQERHLPAIVSHLHPPSCKEILTKKYLHYIKNGENPQINLILLSRWMDDDTRDRWIRSNVRVFNRIMYKRWERKCHRTHGHIAFKFQRRLIRSVKSVAASRLRRRTEFGEQIDDFSFGSLPSQGGSIRSLTLSVGQKVVQSAKMRRNSKEMPRAKTKAR